ncbi:uncharacterized protein LOC111354941 [Spodoptera litura]|uniref:Uncharacterized protein LOC111354941 n=2 Tax=Spodoptera litura TaxID=69820 RepID=A0A9J7E4M4_SPOLT|nr:uncharacterized protein LOC111354941 [Spodoptera litura]
MASTSSDNRQRKKSFIIRRQAREMAKHVLSMCEEEKRSNHFTFTVNQALDRAVYYTGLSKSVLSKIKKEPTDQQGHLKSPSKKGKKYPRVKDLNVDDFDRQVIHRCIEEFYLTKKVVPTCKKLLLALREKIDFPWGVTSLRKLLKQMGYKWQKCHSKRRILIERPNIIYARSIYLRKIRQFRQNDRQIFFLDETWIDNNLTYKKCWRDDKINAILTDTSSSNRLILVHAGSRSGFLDGAKLLFKAGTVTGDYHGQMNNVNFEKWANEMLLPNLPSNSVVVMDNAPYHSVQENKVPTKSSTKQVMLDWLTKNKVQASFSMRKVELYDLIQQNRTPEKTFKMDELIKGHGHDVLRLPPYMCDLNPIELAWAKVKRLVREHNITSDFSLVRLKEVTENAITQVTTADWCGYDKHVLALEEHYWKKDGLMEDVVDSFIIEVREESDDSTSNSSSTDNSDFDSD